MRPSCGFEEGAAMIKGLKFHPLAAMFPLPHKWSTEFLALVEDIRAHGLLVPVVTYQDMILDGRTRVLACDRVGIEIPPDMRVDYLGNDPAGFGISMNSHRRHLAVGTRAFVALRRANSSHGGDRRSQTALARDDVTTYAKAAQEVGVDVRRVEEAASIAKKCLPEIAAAVSSGKLSLWYAINKAAKASKEEQRSFVASGFFKQAIKDPSDPEAPKRKRQSAGQKTMIANFARWFDELANEEKDRVWRIVAAWRGGST
jgi:hypothetical protein